ncbi:unnamed protein product [Calicophoron daubneyi]|uniref:EF-hand domain-containing protein n=1 Tax=Calicophoron daubneyi TaxID=300641 RepID=A0AAV2TQA6_CALDB
MKKEEVKKVLSEIDTDNDGKVSAKQLHDYINGGKCHFNKAIIEKFISDHSKDGNDHLNLDELAEVLSG